MKIHIDVLLAVTPCSVAVGYQRFEGTYCFHLQSFSVCRSILSTATRSPFQTLAREPNILTNDLVVLSETAWQQKANCSRLSLLFWCRLQVLTYSLVFGTVNDECFINGP